MGQAHLMEEGTKDTRPLNRMLTLVETTESFYRREYADLDARNLSYYRGKFWRGDGALGIRDSTREYSATQNEIFPVIDTQVSTLAQDVPAVECRDIRVRRAGTPARHEDPSFAGEGIAAVLNLWSEEEELDVVTRQLILHGCLFRYGVAKTWWDATANRSATTALLPWEVHFDPSAKRVKDANWAFHRFTLSHDELMSRIEQKAYERPAKEIKPSAYPRSLVDEANEDEHYRQLRDSGVNEWHSLVEFWDFRRNEMCHIDPASRQVLMKTTIPWGNPFTVLTFHDGVGRIDGISDVSLLADNQRDINELVSARREIVRRLPRRVLVARDLFQDEDEWKRWKNSKTWEPTRVTPVAGKTIADSIFVMPEVPTTYDFQASLSQSAESIRRVAGIADFQRGGVKNIRTAAEAYMVQGGADGRVAIRMKNVVRATKSIFRISLQAWRWAIQNPEDSRIDMESITDATNVGIEPSVLAREASELSFQFRLLPFTPLMEDKNVRRQQFVQMMQLFTAPGIAEVVNQRELARELFEMFDIRPSVLKSTPEINAEQAEQALAAAMQQAPEGAR